MGALGKNGWLALFGALMLHTAVLLIQFSFNQTQPDVRPELSVTLLDEPVLETLEKPETPKKETQEPDKPVTKPSPPIQPRPSPPSDEIIVAKPSNEPTEQPKVTIDVSVSSDEFKKFLRNETDSYRSANPESLDSFKQTFNPTFNPTKPEITEVSPSSKASQRQMRRTGVGMSQDKNGKRTCYAQIPALASDFDPPQLLSKDCTEPKKFELDLTKPRNN